MEVTGKPHISVTKTGNDSLVLDTFYTTDMPITNQQYPIRILDGQSYRASLLPSAICFTQEDSQIENNHHIIRL
jgi:hypothetical protein